MPLKESPRKKPSKVRQAWLAERSTYLGATDVSAILGEHPYKTAHDVWLDKRGELQIEENTPMWLGIHMEPVIAKHFAERYRVKIRTSHLYRHPRFPFCACNPDRELIWQGMPALLECKTAGHWAASEFGEDGSDAIPSHYLTQVAWQLLITGAKVVILYVLLDNREFKPYIYSLDPALSTIAHVFPHEDVVKMFTIVVRWWQKHIVEGIEPEMTGRKPDTAYLQKARSTYENGKRTNADQETDALCRSLEGLLLEEVRASSAANECKNKIKKFMAEAGADMLDWGTSEENKKPFTWRVSEKGIATFRHPFRSGNA